MHITLNEAEKRLCLFVARSRNAAAREVAPEDALRVSPKDPIFVDYEGAMGELAFSKMLGVYPTEIFEIYHRSSLNGEDPGDLTFNNLVIDVKTTIHKTGRLISFRKNPAINMFVLMTGQDGEYDLAGGMWSSDLYLPSRYGVPSGLSKECYCATQDELLDSKQVMESISF
tara:strand:+ start:347 stop:859 length:513 start_codon:yes stop_codon:yes gene_type:complete